MATESANGSTEEPLPATTPHDADHINTPRDRRAEALAAHLKGRTEAAEQPNQLTSNEGVDQ